jgi:hypothetical protein
VAEGDGHSDREPGAATARAGRQFGWVSEGLGQDQLTEPATDGDMAERAYPLGRWRPLPLAAAMAIVRDEPLMPGFRCQGQLIKLPPRRYDWVYLRLIGIEISTQQAGESMRPADEVWLHYATTTDPEWLHLAPGSVICRIPVPRPMPLHLLRMPDCPSLRVGRIVLLGTLPLAGLVTADGLAATVGRAG